MIEESGVRALDTYATTTEYKSEIPLDDIRNGVVPLDSLPAAWWNWLWNQVTLEEGHIKIALDAIIEEIKSVLAGAQVTPSAASNNQLLAAIVKVSQRYGSPDEAGAVKSSDTPGKVKIEEDGTMTANGLGSTTELTTTLKTSVVQAINELVVRADTQDNNWNTKVNEAETRLSSQYTEAVTNLDTKLTTRFEELQRTVDLPKYTIDYTELFPEYASTSSTIRLNSLLGRIIKKYGNGTMLVTLTCDSGRTQYLGYPSNAGLEELGYFDDTNPLLLLIAKNNFTITSEEGVSTETYSGRAYFSIRNYASTDVHGAGFKGVQEIICRCVSSSVVLYPSVSVLSTTGTGSVVTNLTLAKNTLTVTKGNPITLSTSGSGNAVTGVSLSGSTLTVTKGNPITLSTSGSGNAVTGVSLSGSTLTVYKHSILWPTLITSTNKDTILYTHDYTFIPPIIINILLKEFNPELFTYMRTLYENNPNMFDKDSHTISIKGTGNLLLYAEIVYPVYQIIYFIGDSNNDPYIQLLSRGNGTYQTYSLFLDSSGFEGTEFLSFVGYLV